VKTVDEGPAHIFVRFRYGLGLPIPKSSMTSAEKDALLSDLRGKVEEPSNPALNPTGLRPAG